MARMLLLGGRASEAEERESHVSTTTRIPVPLKLWASVRYVLQPARQII